MNRHIQEPFTMSKYPELQHTINEMIIAIKIHELIEVDEKVLKARERINKPTWEEIVSLLSKIEKALNQERYNPIKY